MTRISNAPDAAALMTTARSFGNYDLAGALADVIDNAINAQCSVVDIVCEYLSDCDCRIRIRDDGRGMSREELVRAMRPASADPRDERAADDLGRFGWGMKSASFSQCKILTVVTLQGDVLSAARWDLDNIANWEMDLYEGGAASDFLAEPFAGNGGTELIWSDCDRLSEGRTLTREQFTESLAAARRKLSQIFHRYISGERGKYDRVRIRLNGQLLDALDPFCSENPATIVHPVEPITVKIDGADHQIVMQAFVLPHFSKLTAHDYEEHSGEEGYVRNQGFYVYRNRRLIISGTWFGLAKHGELSKLVRVRIDIPNSLDEMWKITVDKTDAQLPAALRARMRSLVEQFRKTSLKVFRSRGARVDSGRLVPVWERRVRNGVVRYLINREHPLVEALDEQIDEELQAAVGSLLTLLETQVPVDAIAAEVAAGEARPEFLSREELVDFLDAALPTLMRKAGSKAKLIETLKETEPFASNWAVVGPAVEERFCGV